MMSNSRGGQKQYIKVHRRGAHDVEETCPPEGRGTDALGSRQQIPTRCYRGANAQRPPEILSNRASGVLFTC